MTMQQLALGLQLRDDATFDNFYRGSNQLLIAALHSLCAGNEKFIYLHGAEGSGRSHLLQACCHLVGESMRPCVYLPLSDPMLTPDVLQDIESMSLICIDDIDVIAGNRDWEEALFHLYNRLLMVDGSTLLVSAQHPATQTNFSLPDLKSRLSAGLMFHLHALIEDDKSEVLRWRAKQRGFTLSSEVTHFLLTRCSRNTTQLFEVLDKLDKASFETQRKLTIPFIKSVLEL